MEQKTAYSATFLRKRKFLVRLPLMALPFITLAFWALGGGKGQTSKNEHAFTGLNLALPDAQLKEEEKITKLQFYERADKEGRSNSLKDDPVNFLDSVNRLKDFGNPASFSYDPTPYGLEGPADPNEEKVYKKLEQLNRQLQHTMQPANKSTPISTQAPRPPRGGVTEIKGLPASPQQEKDPELAQLNAMMDKILDIQHPDRLKERHKANPVEALPIYTAEQAGSAMSISLLETGERKDGSSMNTRFYTIEAGQRERDVNIIEAVIHGTQKLKDGALVKLRLLQEMRVGKTRIPRGTLLYGTARQQGERLQVQITTVRYQQFIFPLALQVYDLDGQEGIYIPDTISGDVAKGAVDQSLQQLDWSTLDPSFEAKVATAGVQAVKRLLSKKAKQK